MGKNKIKKRMKRVRLAHSKGFMLKTDDPKSFFKRIGITCLGHGNNQICDAERAILRLGKRQVIEAFHRASEKEDKTQSALTDFFYSSLDLVKVKCGADFNAICRIANELRKVPVAPKSRILDIGGGAGHLAFWMAAIWKTCSVTVADKYSHLGKLWAKEIDQDRVSFVDATLPDLGALKGLEFDVLILSRLVNVLLDHTLPNGATALSFQEYFDGSSAKELLRRLDEIVNTVDAVLAPNGKVIVVESWSSARILIFARAFAKKGIHINLDLFPEKRVGIDYSIVVYSKLCNPTPIQNVPVALAVRIDFGGTAHRFEGSAAESIRKLFGDVEPTFYLQYTVDDGECEALDEVLEREGLMLLYRSSTTGAREAVLDAATKIPKVMEDLQEMEQDLMKNGSGRVIKKFIAERR